MFPDSETLVTGSQDSKLRIWRLTRQDQAQLSLLYILTGHQEPILSVVASRAWSLVVSGSEDGCAMLWELNRAQYVRKIEHGAPVHLVAINESTVGFSLCCLLSCYLTFYRVILPHVREKSFVCIP
jgi:WD40 repeat protein